MRAALVVLAGCSTPHAVPAIRRQAAAPQPAIAGTSWSYAVLHEVPLSPRPGAEPLGAYLEPGFPLPATVASWLPVHLDHPIAIDGWVPSSARGLSNEHARISRASVQLEPFVLVYDAPATDGAIVAMFDEGALALPGTPGTWIAVDTVVARVRVVGWTVVPDTQLTRPNERVFDFSDDTIEGDLVKPEGVID